MSNPSVESEMAELELSAYAKLKEYLYREPTMDEMAEEIEYLLDKYKYPG